MCRIWTEWCTNVSQKTEEDFSDQSKLKISSQSVSDSEKLRFNIEVRQIAFDILSENIFSGVLQNFLVNFCSPYVSINCSGTHKKSTFHIQFKGTIFIRPGSVQCIALSFVRPSHCFSWDLNGVTLAVEDANTVTVCYVEFLMLILMTDIDGGLWCCCWCWCWCWC